MSLRKDNVRQHSPHKLFLVCGLQSPAASCGVAP